MKLKHLTTLFAILGTLALLPACEEEAETTTETPTTETAPEPAAEATARQHLQTAYGRSLSAARDRAAGKE